LNSFLLFTIQKKKRFNGQVCETTSKSHKKQNNINTPCWEKRGFKAYRLGIQKTQEKGMTTDFGINLTSAVCFLPLSSLFSSIIKHAHMLLVYREDSRRCFLGDKCLGRYTKCVENIRSSLHGEQQEDDTRLTQSFLMQEHNQRADAKIWLIWAQINVLIRICS
jgi:hypothetical protein